MPRTRVTPAHIAKARRAHWDLMKRIMARYNVDDPKDLPTISENEERALRSVARYHQGAIKELIAENSGPPTPPVQITLHEVSTEELKRQIAAQQESEIK